MVGDWQRWFLIANHLILQDSQSPFREMAVKGEYPDALWISWTWKQKVVHTCDYWESPFFLHNFLLPSILLNPPVCLSSKNINKQSWQCTFRELEVQSLADQIFPITVLSHYINQRNQKLWIVIVRRKFQLANRVFRVRIRVGSSHFKESSGVRALKSQGLEFRVLEMARARTPELEWSCNYVI